MKLLASVLLVLGVIFGALAAAGSKKAFRTIALDPGQDQSAEVVYRTVSFQRVPGETPIVIAEKGAALDVTVATRLINANFESVRVRHPAKDAETVPLDAAKERVLANAIDLTGTEETLKSGRILNKEVAERAKQAGVAEVLVRIIGDTSDNEYAISPELLLGIAAKDKTKLAADRLPAQPELRDVGLGDLKLAAGLIVPRRLKAGTFLDKERLSDLTALGLTEVAVKVQVPFSFAHWTERWYFLGAVLMVLAAIGLMRAGAGAAETSEAGATPAGEVHSALEQLVSECDRLAETAAGMDADAIHQAIDPIHAGSLYTIIEGRDAARTKLGLTTYAVVYGPLATGERQLNRAWSAAVDGYIDEARICAANAAPHFREALAAWPAS